MRTLLFGAGAAIAAAITYAVIFGDGRTSITAEDDGSSVRHTVRGDASEFSMRDGARAIKANWRGAIKLSKDASAIKSIGEYIVIDIEEDGVVERVRLERDGRKLTRSYWLDDEEQAPGADTDARIDELAQRFLRASGLEAKTRVALLLENGGAEAVLAEIDRLTSDYAIRRYGEALTETGALRSADVEALLGKFARLEGDHYIAQSLEAVAQTQKLDDAALAAVLTLAGNIDSDYEKRRVVTAAAQRKLSAANAGRALDLIEEIDSEYDFRVSAETLLDHGALNADAVAQLLALSGERIDSDHDLRLILTRAAPRMIEGGVGEAWLSAYDRLDADYDRRIALETASGPARSDAALLSRLRTKAAAIDADYDRERALAALK